MVVAGTTSLSETAKKAFKNHKVTARDVLIPRVNVMQPGSEKVLEGAAQFGELRETLDNKLLGKIGQPLSIVPFHTESVWVVVEADAQNNRVFKEIVRVEAGVNEQLPFEEALPNGKKLIRTYTINMYFLLPSEVEAGEDLPYVLSFRSTSLRAGKKVNTTMYMKNFRAGKAPWAVAMNLTATKTQNDKGTFAVLDVQTTRAATEEESNAAAHWCEMVMQGQTKLDTSGMEKAEGENAPVESDAF